ncbi:hypothetical protein ACHHYP_03494 [Achlya hypogyna]|uniref:Uncharacterized protein n=1 Tax=Achlya hypogyna TaxID=1202772 RepID=A0A1V9Z3K0_ACHHY|nr:hypothetical protein ACHHYP_03494 [Achlya hypogyna]
MAPRGSKRMREPAMADDEPATAPTYFEAAAIETWKVQLAKEWHFQAPQDFFTVYGIARAIAPDAPLGAFKKAIGIELTGPFVALASDSVADLPTPVFLHGRQFYDPPEVITVATCDAFHLGYHRDAPKQLPTCLVQGTRDSGEFAIVGQSLVDVLHAKLVGCTDGSALLPHFTLHVQKLNATTRKTKRSTLSDAASVALATRESAWTAPTLSGLGIAVPVHAKTGVGFRELPTQGRQLRALLQKPRGKDLDDLLTRANIACDECEFGTTLQLGLDLFTQRNVFESEAQKLLDVAYLLLHRGAFSTVLRQHVQRIRNE